ncbi:MAG TPA: helix-turn-helix domain-containing protein [Acidimicrobiales bacterium]
MGPRTAKVVSATTEARSLRRDAELNLARILVAARDVFAEHGYEASMEQIAARAGVGVGTLYRRFPNKADLFAAVVDAATDRTREIADEVLLEVAPDEGVFEFVRRCVDAPSCWRAATSRRPWSGGGADRALAALVPLIGRILESGQRAGTVRTDIGPTDLVVTLMSVRALGDLCDADAPGTSRRFLELALDGLRPGHQTPAHPPMSVKQLGRVLTAR